MRFPLVNRLWVTADTSIGNLAISPYLLLRFTISSVWPETRKRDALDDIAGPSAKMVAAAFRQRVRRSVEGMFPRQ
jgi:type IV secretory pathway component VirB8